MKSVSQIRRERFKENSGETLRDVILVRIKDLEADYRKADLFNKKQSIMKALQMNSELIHGSDFKYIWKD